MKHMNVFNTLTRKKEEFIPLVEGEYKIYVCGPTVYNYIHIGNARPAVVFDTLRRYLEYKGNNVKYVSNITDVDDKIIKRSIEEGITFEEVARKYENEYYHDLQGLNVRLADARPRVSDHIPEIIDLAQTLIDKEHAYRVDNGDVYFRVHSFKDYGNLSHQPLEELEAGARIEVGEIKEAAADFALWKAAKPGEPHWHSHFSEGRPGWHIECSAMSRKHLGETIDLHCGGQDLIFPHHENEIAQSECANGCKFVNYWLHNGFVTINKEKMSKSLGNFLTIDDMLKLYDANTIRFFILTNHYRMPVEFSDEALQAAANGVKRMLNAKQTKIDESLDLTQYEEYKEFVNAMDDDMNTSKALAVLFDLATKANKDVDYAFTLLHKLATTLGFTFEKAKLSEDELAGKLLEISAELGETYTSMEEIIAKRKEAREAKNWEVADKIRVALDKVGIVLKDS